MAEETVVTNIVANANFSGLISDLNRVTASLANLQAQVSATNKGLASQIAVVNRQFGDTLRSTGQFTTHFASAGSDVETFGKNLDKGRLKLREYYRTWQDHNKTASGLIRDLAQQQVRLQNSIMQPLGRNAEGMMQFAVHVPRGLDVIKNKTAIAHQELMIMNRVMQEGANQLINWGKNTQWAGRQLTVGLTVPLAAFGKAAADAFKTADQELVRLTKVYGDLAGTSAAELGKVREEVTQTAKALASGLGASFNETLALGADIAATGKTGEELLGSIRETTRLAVLGEVDRQEAMKATLAIQTAFNQNTTELADSINFLNAVENQTSTTLNDLVEAIPRAGTIIKGLGGSVQDLALYLTAMREGGVSASEGANALKSALASLINPTDVAVAKFEGFGIDLLGIVKNNAGDVTQTLLALQGALDNLDPLQKQQAIEQLFGKFQFARLGALFDNLGRQGSQTLQVMDLMKASSDELANVASRELTAVTESASGKYRRALEELKADLASVGEQFLTINTYLIKFVDKIIDFATNLPGPIKSLLSFLGGITAIAGPLIMLTGVLGNFFGYIVKGVYHFKSLFKSAEGWRLLTPEIMAANQAGSVAESTFYSDARAAQILNQSLKDLAVQYDGIAARAQSGAISVQPMMSTMAGNVVMPGGGGRVVDPNNPLAGPMGTRASAHMVPRGTQQPGTIFGLVPSSMPVNLAVGANPQVYMQEALPMIPGVTSVQTKKYGQVSTGIVASEAARHHAMTATLAMQSTQEVENLKKVMATTGTVTSEFMQTFDDLVPITSQITQNAASQSAMIVAELRAGKITVETARQRIIALNLEIERMLGAAATEYAAATGRTINLTNVPTLNQPVMTSTGKSNMRELFKSRTKGFFDNVARSLGVRTSGAGYNIQTTKPRKLNMGGYVYTMNDGNIVPGPNVNADVVPAMLTPGEFVVNRESAQANLPLLMAINGGAGSSGPGYMTGGQIQTLINMPGEFLRRSLLVSGARRVNGRSNRQAFSPGAINYDQMASREGRNAAWNNPILALGKPNTDEVVGHIYSNQFYRRYGQASGGSSPRVTAPMFQQLTGVNIPPSRTGYTGQYDILPNQLMTISRSFNTRLNRGGARASDWFANPRKPEHLLSLMELLTSQGLGAKQAASIAQRVLNRINTNIGRLPQNAIISERMFGNIVTNSTRQEMNRLRDIGELNQRQAASKPLPRGTYTPGAYMGYNRRNSGGMIRMNRGGMVPGYNRGGIAANLRMRGYLPGRNYSPLNIQDGQIMPGPVPSGMSMSSNMMLGMAGSMGGGAAGGAVGGQTGALIGSMAGYALPSLVTKLMAAAKAAGGFLKVVMSIGKFLKMWSIPGAIVTVLGFGIKKLLDWKKAAEEAGKANRLAFGGTADSFASVGIKNYTTITDRIKDINEQLELHRAQVRSTYESYTKAGPTGLTLTIKELREAIENAKETQKDYVNAFNNIDSSRVTEYATQLKSQFVAMGMAASEATNQIYAIIKASNKASQAINAISTDSFKSIQKQTDGIKMLITGLKNELNSNDFNAEEFTTGLDTLLNSLIMYQQGLVGTKDDAKNIRDEADALAETLKEIASIQGATNDISGNQLEQIKNQNITYSAILSDVESIQSVYAKIALYEQGFGRMLDLARMTAREAVNFANNLSMIQNELNDITESAGENNPLQGLNTLISKAKTEADNATGVVNKLKKVDESYYDAKIKAIQKTIDKLEEERRKRLELLRLTKESTDFATTIEQSQNRLKNLIASGNMEAAAQEQLNIKKLSQERQYNLAVDAINNKFDKDRKAEEEKLAKLQEAKDRMSKGMESAQTRAAVKTADLATLQSFRDQIETVVQKYVGQKNPIISKADKEELSVIIKQMKDAGGQTKAEALAMEKKYGFAQSVIPGGKAFATNLVNAFNVEINARAESDVKFKTAVESFAAAVLEFKGKTSTTDKTSIQVVTGSLGSIRQVSSRALSKEGVSTEKGTKFRASDGKEYEITRQVGQNYYVKPTGRWSFGRVVPGRDYVVGERGPELFRTDVPGNIMPKYNVPNSNYKFNSAGNNGTMGNISLTQTINAAPGMDERMLANLAAKQAAAMISAAQTNAMYRNGKNVRVGNA